MNYNHAQWLHVLSSQPNTFRARLHSENKTTNFSFSLFPLLEVKLLLSQSYSYQLTISEARLDFILPQ